MKTRAVPRELVWCIDSPGYGGAERDLVRVIEMVRPTWPEQLVACGGPVAAPLAKAMAVNGIRWEPFVSRARIQHMGSSWRAAGKLLAAHPRAAWVVWCHHFDSGRWLQQRLASSGLPFIIAERNMAWDREVFARSRLTRPLKRRAVNCAMAVVVPGRAQATMYSELFDIPEQLIRFIPNGRPVATLSRQVTVAQSSRRDLRLALRLPAEGVVVLCLARLDVQKGQDVLIRAMARARTKLSGLHLCLAGDGPLRKVYEDLAASHLGEGCTILGERDDVTDLLACADVFVLPSRYEGLSGALVEAMAAEVPIVASDIPANRELISHHGTGLLFKSESCESLSSAILETVTNPGAASDRAKAALELVASSYDERNERAGWKRLLAEMAGKGD